MIMDSRNKVNKVVFNTFVLYAKILLSSLVSLVSVPIVLNSLGQSDYGLFCLIAGVISMLSFFNNSLTVSTQRFMSVSIGENNFEKFNSIYTNSIVLHLVLGLLLFFVLEMSSFCLFDGFLKIDGNRVHAAKIIYHFLVFSMFCTVVSVPFNAVLNAKEDMFAFSIIHLVESFLKLGAALILPICSNDKLIVYGLLMAFISLLIMISLYVYVKLAYKEIKFSMNVSFDKKLFRSMTFFSGWNTLAAIAMLGRNQGVAIIVNKFFGVISNAAYGIANQVNGVMNYFSSTFQKALNPQLMQSEGMNDRNRLIKISIISSKYSVFCFSFLSIPLFFELPYILDLWLKNIPPNAIEMVRLVLILSFVYQFSSGLMSGIQAIGKIKYYQLTMSLIILLNVPLIILIYSYNCPVYYCFYIAIVLEIISLITRMFFSRTLMNLKIRTFVFSVIVPATVVVAIPSVFLYTIISVIQESFVRLIISFITAFCVFSFVCYFIGMNAEEKDSMRRIVNGIRKKFL